mmetsp:Transcript_5120/g.9799  ORF Transcript_5120/g.9799 Transcript_5120/m.9799 type:complete len:201 (+) Transcript_5120:460-1062(+)
MCLSLRTLEVDYGQRRVMACEGESCTRWAPCNTLDPATSLVKLAEQLTKRLCGSVRASTIWQLILTFLNKGRENAALEVGAACEQQLVVWMPSDLQDGRLVLLDHLGNPPIVGFFVVAHRYALCSRSNSKLASIWRPLDINSSAVDTQNYQRWLPFVVLESPHEGVTVMRAGDQLVGHWGPVNTAHQQVVFGENVSSRPC